VQPKLIMNNVVEQLDAMLAGSAEESGFYKPLTALPATCRNRSRRWLRSAYARSIATSSGRLLRD
jgi:uncharacterized protein (DUF885 family)